MIQSSTKFAEAVSKDSRTFQVRLTCGSDVIYGVKSLVYSAASNASDHVSIGGTVSASVQITMEKPSVPIEAKELTVEIGVLSDEGYVYCTIGKFTPEKISDDDGIITFTAYDRMYTRFSRRGAIPITYPADGRDILYAIRIIRNVPISNNIVNLPSGVMIPLRQVVSEMVYDDDGNPSSSIFYVPPFSSYTLQDTIGYIAQMYGKYAVITRDGTLDFRWYKEVDYTIPASRYYDDLKTNGNAFKMGRITCQKETETLVSGEGTIGMQIENPVMTQSVLDSVYDTLRDFSFQPASVSFLGDPRLEVGDIVTVRDKYGKEIKIPIMKITMDFDGGLITTIESVGKTEVESTSISSSTGPTAQAIERLSNELYSVKEIVGEKARFEDLKATKAAFDEMNASYGEFADLTTKRLEAGEANIEQLKTENADISGRLTAGEAEIKVIKTDKADVKELNAANAKIDNISGDLANYKVIVTGSLEAVNAVLSSLDANYAKIDLANIEKGCITTAMIGVGVVGSAQIADGSITDAKIVDLTANKITAGTLSVERLIICGDKNSIIYAINNAGELVSQNVNTIDGDVLTKRSITADKIVAGAITANEIAGKTITANEIATGAITAGELAAGSVTAEKIKAGAISADKISASSITVDKIAFGTCENLYIPGLDNFDNAPFVLCYYSIPDTEEYVHVINESYYKSGMPFGVPGDKGLLVNTIEAELAGVYLYRDYFVIGDINHEKGFTKLTPGKKYIVSFYGRCLESSGSKDIDFKIFKKMESADKITHHPFNGRTIEVSSKWERYYLKFTCPTESPYISLGFKPIFRQETFFIFTGFQIEDASGNIDEPGTFKLANRIQVRLDPEGLASKGIASIADDLGIFQKGILESGNYSGSYGEAFSGKGFLIDLYNGYINTPKIRIAGNGKTYCNYDGIAVDTDALVRNYAICYTAGGTTAKTVSLTGFKLYAGARVTVRFNYANSAVNPTLNVNSTGAKPIYYKNSNIPAWLIPQYAVMELVYSGSYWYVVGVLDERRLLSTTYVKPTALTTWAYTTEISGLAVYDEIQVWVEVGDGFRGWVTLSRNDPRVACITGYVSPAYYGCAWIQWDKTNNKIGVYACTVTGWTVANVSVSMITGTKLTS